MNKKNVLVVDDESVIRKSFEYILAGKGLGVVTAANGKAALEAFRTGKFDLIFLDLKMPEMNGVEAFIRIRAADPAIPVYIVTAFDRDYLKDLDRLAEKGLSFDILRKPFTRDQIESIALGIVGKSGSSP